MVDTLIEEGHVRRIIYMDNASADVIKDKRYSLYAGLGRSIFWRTPQRELVDLTDMGWRGWP